MSDTYNMGVMVMDEYVEYHGMYYKVLEFRHLESGTWLDIGVGYLVRSDRVSIVDLG